MGDQGEGEQRRKHSRGGNADGDGTAWPSPSRATGRKNRIHLPIGPAHGITVIRRRSHAPFSRPR
jgi:hypothetical protein